LPIDLTDRVAKVSIFFSWHTDILLLERGFFFSLQGMPKVQTENYPRTQFRIVLAGERSKEKGAQA
jgi:hypothetical protein